MIRKKKKTHLPTITWRKTGKNATTEDKKKRKRVMNRGHTGREKRPEGTSGRREDENEAFCKGKKPKGKDYVAT